MSLVEAMRKMGGKLGLIQLVTLPHAPDAPRSATRTVTLAQLTTEISSHEVKALAALPAEMEVDFAKVFEAAGIPKPAHGWTLDHLQKLLSAEPYSTMERPTAQKMLLEAMAKDHALVEDLVKDAMARDKAIDAYAGFVKKKMDERGEIRQQRLAELESQVHDLQEQCRRLNEENRADGECWKQWKGRKVACEKQMAWAIGHLLDQPVITIDASESNSV